MDMAKRDFSKARRNPRGYEQAAPRDRTQTDRGGSGGAVLKPFLGYDDPMADPRVEGYVELEYGVPVRRVGRPC